MSSPEMLALYSELGQEMRALRATEFSVATIFYAVVGFLVAGSFSVLATDSLSSSVKIAVIGFTVASFFAIYAPVHHRIARDNTSYAHLMVCRRFIEKQWFWQGMPVTPSTSTFADPAPGYRLTQRMLFGSLLVFSLTLVAALVFTLQYPSAKGTEAEKSATDQVPAAATKGTSQSHHGTVAQPQPASPTSAARK